MSMKRHRPRTLNGRAAGGKSPLNQPDRLALVASDLVAGGLLFRRQPTRRLVGGTHVFIAI